MALFPTSPTNGQQTTINNITYTYDSAQTAWVRSSVTGNVIANNGGFSGNITATNITLTKNMIFGVANGITATGTVQANAQAITKDINVVNTVLAGTGVSLPAAVAGYRITIVNTSANVLNVYPLGNGVINSLSANVAYSHQAGARLDFICVSASNAPGGQWYTLNATYG